MTIARSLITAIPRSIIRPIPRGGGDTGLAAVYWRVNVLSNNGGGNIGAISEIYLQDSDSVTFDYTGGTVTGSATVAGNIPAHAFDGLTANDWAWNAGFPQWVQMQFPEAKAVFRIGIQGVNSSLPGQDVNAPNDMTIEYSDNGSDWTEILAIDDQTSWGAGEVRYWDLQ